MTWSIKLIYSLQTSCCDPYSAIVRGKTLSHVGGLPGRRLRDLISSCTDKTALLKSARKQTGKSGCTRQPREQEWVTKANSSMKRVCKEIRGAARREARQNKWAHVEHSPRALLSCCACLRHQPGHPKPSSLSVTASKPPRQFLGKAFNAFPRGKEGCHSRYRQILGKNSWV